MQWHTGCPYEAEAIVVHTNVVHTIVVHTSDEKLIVL